MARDRDATERRIVEAVGRVLAAEGFRGVGVRAVAREAGVDKRLIYRYFGGMPALIKAYAASGDFWWTVDELIGDDLPGPAEDTASAWMALAMKRHMRALRRRPLTQEILVWELSERNALTDELAALRERRAAELIKRLSEAPSGMRAGAWTGVGALIAAGTTYLVARSRTCDFYAGVDLRGEAGWKVFERAIDRMTDAMLVDEKPTRKTTRKGKRCRK